MSEILSAPLVSETSFDVGEYDLEDGSPKFPFAAFDYVLKTIYARPVIVATKGDWEKGKTDFSLLKAERLISLGVVSRVIGNIVLKKDVPPPDWFEFCTSFDRLKFLIHSDRRSKLVLYDEASANTSRRRPMSEKNVSLIEMIPELSKAHTRLDVITQDPKGTDKDIIENPVFVKAQFIKTEKKNCTVVAPSMFEEPIYLSGIPPTSIPYERDEKALFTMHEKATTPTAWLKVEDFDFVKRWAEGATWASMGVEGVQGHRKLRRFILTVTSKMPPPTA